MGLKDWIFSGTDGNLRIYRAPPQSAPPVSPGFSFDERIRSARLASDEASTRARAEQSQRNRALALHNEEIQRGKAEVESLSRRVNFQGLLDGYGARFAREFGCKTSLVARQDFNFGDDILYTKGFSGNVYGEYRIASAKFWLSWRTDAKGIGGVRLIENDVIKPGYEGHAADIFSVPRRPSLERILADAFLNLVWKSPRPQIERPQHHVS